MLVRKTNEQKIYLLRLKKDITDFLINFKKRYKLFPWEKLNKVTKLNLEYQETIVVNETEFTLKELVKIINRTKSNLQSKLKPSYFNFILKAYIKDSMNQKEGGIKPVYKQYKEELDNIFKEMKLDLTFCLEGLTQINKVYNPKKKIIKESYDTLTESFDYNELKEFNNELNSYDYGVLINGKVMTNNPDFKKYKTISLDDFKKYKAGVCWDFVNYESKWLKDHNYKHDCIFIQIDNKNDCPSHTFVLVYDKSKVIWFESSWNKYQGLHEYNSKEDAIKDIVEKHREFSKKKSKISINDKTYIFEYNTKNLDNNLSPLEYMKNIYKQTDITNKYLKENVELFQENVLLNKSDLYYNFEKFEKGNTNVLLITGFSGSGKSSLASELSSKYKCEYFELDALDFFFGGNLTKEEMEKGEPGLLAFLNVHKEYEPKKIPGNNEYKKIYVDYIQFLINWCKKQKDKKFIIEGLQIYETFDEKNPQSYIRSNSLIIKGTSGLVSAIRGAKRNNKENEDTTFFKEFNSLIKWVLQDEKQLKKLYKYVKESEDINMFDVENRDNNMKFVNEHGELEDVRDFVLSIYEALELEEDEDESEEVTEGANLKSRRVYKNMKKEVKALTKKYKKSMKDEKYSDAKNCLKTIKKIIAQAEDDIRSFESTSLSISFGQIADFLLSITRNIYLLIPIAGPFIANAKNKKYSLDKLAKVEDNIKKSDDVTADIYNDYKNYLLIHINSLKEEIKKLEDIVANEEKISKRIKSEKEKKDIKIEESAKFNSEKLSIYESCKKGEITVEEREELLHELQNKYYLLEASRCDESFMEETLLSNKEKFEKVRTVLYERCKKGELTVEERENLISKAKETIFAESDNMSMDNKNTQKNDAQIKAIADKAQKEMEMNIDKAVK